MRLASTLAVVASLALGCGGVEAPPNVAANGAATDAQHAPHAHWTYSGETGPAHWAELDPAFAACRDGRVQTPIDLPAPAASSPASTARPSWTWMPLPLRAVNDGHTVRVEAPPGSGLTLEGARYELKQMHFHSPSEHTIAGRAFDAELHLVHSAANGRLLVVGVLFARGAENATLRALFDSLPRQGGAKVERTSEALDVAALVAPTSRLLRYDGSLTTPPCTEGVTWLVVEPDASAPLTLSPAQIDAYRAAMPGPTARPVQPSGGRAVVELAP